MDWWKYVFFTKGISPNEFRKCQVRDIKNIMDIHNVMNQKITREQRVQDEINKIKW